jgi:acyl carrier protein
MSDIIEIIEHVERSFDIAIDNNEAKDLVTVGDIHNYIVSRVIEEKGTKCLTQVAFYKIKNFLLQEKLKIPYSLNIQMNQLFPHQTRNKLYSNISKNNSEWYFPILEHNISQWLRGKGLRSFEKQQTLKEFTEQFLALNFRKLSNEARNFNSQDVLKSIKYIISYQLGIHVIDINSNHSLTTDLKAD